MSERIETTGEAGVAWQPRTMGDAAEERLIGVREWKNRAREALRDLDDAPCACDDDAHWDPDSERLIDWVVAGADGFLNHLSRHEIGHVIEEALWQVARRVRAGQPVRLPEIGTLSLAVTDAGARVVRLEADPFIVSEPGPRDAPVPADPDPARGISVEEAMTIDSLLAALEPHLVRYGGDLPVVVDIDGEGGWVEPAASVAVRWLHMDTPQRGTWGHLALAGPDDVDGPQVRALVISDFAAAAAVGGRHE